MKNLQIRGPKKHPSLTGIRELKDRLTNIQSWYTMYRMRTYVYTTIDMFIMTIYERE